MKHNEIIESIQKGINSVLFRATLILYSIVLFLLFSISLNIYLFILTIIAYFVVYLYLSKRPKTRMFFDFLFILIILWGNNPSEIYFFIFLILPIINNINFSGYKKSLGLLYLFTFICYFIVLISFKKDNFFNDFNNDLYSILSVGILFIIDWYSALKKRFDNFKIDIEDIIERYYTDEKEIKRPYQIYLKIIELINEKIISIKILNIICLRTKQTESNDTIIVNSANYILHFKFKQDDSISRLKEKHYLTNEPIIIDGSNYSFNTIHYKKVKESEYIFIITTDKILPFYYFVTSFFRIFDTTFTKLAWYLLREQKLNSIKKKELIELSDKRQYLQQARKLTHFMKNRLGSISNLIKMIDEHDKIEPLIIKNFEELMGKETKTAKTNMRLIGEKCDALLSNSNNPFLYTSLTRYPVSEIHELVNKNINDFFDSSELELLIQDYKLINMFVTTNIEGLFMLITDWFSNMSKYNESILNFKFELNNKTLSLIFVNNYNPKHHLEIENLVKDLKLNNKNEILKRTTHGLSNIKDCLVEMNLEFDIFSDSKDSLITFKLIFEVEH